MTDNEIVKALEICDMGSCCDECAYRNYSRCNEMLAHDALGIISRQKAEIERLKGAYAEVSTFGHFETGGRKA